MSDSSNVRNGSRSGTCSRGNGNSIRPTFKTNANPTIGYAKCYSRSHDAVIRVYDAVGNVIETHEPPQT